MKIKKGGPVLTQAQIEQIGACQSEREARRLFPDVTRAKIREIRKSAGEPEMVNAVAELLRKSGIDPSDISRVEKVRLNEWQGLIKDSEGEAQIIDMKAASIILTPSWADGPEWPVIDRADPVHIHPEKSSREDRTFRVGMFASDPHIGYRRLDDELLPFHDERALSIFLQIAHDLNPDLIINGGDTLDLAEWSMKFATTPEMQYVTQPSINRAHRFLAQQKAAAPNARIVLMEGNHDRRMELFVGANARAAMRLKRADNPEGWPVLSVPYLLGLDTLGVKYVEGYPACWYKVNDNLITVHGHKSKANASTAASMIDDERISVLFGHTHRHESQYKTRRVLYGETMSGKTNLTQSFGCLCHTDGRVPSTKGATDLAGRPIPTAENWQQGFGVISYTPDNGPFDIEKVFISDGLAIFRGKVYVA